VIIRQVFEYLKPVEIQGKRTDLLDARNPALALLAGAKRPLLLSQLCQGEDGHLSLFLETTQRDETDPLLAAVRVRGKMVGILVLGPREDRQAYAGPDFEALGLIFTRFSSVLETARLHMLDSSYAGLLMKIFKGLPRPTIDRFDTIESLAQDYAKLAASATSSSAEIWLASERGGAQFLRRSSRILAGPLLLKGESIDVASLRVEARVPFFATWHASPDWSDFALLCDSEFVQAEPMNGSGGFPFAWLPLVRGDQIYGVIILTYARPHTFSQKEQRLLALFAQQYATALEHATFTLEQGTSYARQLELDRVQHQFWLAAMVDLRTPLATVAGYIELLRDYSTRLTPETRVQFLARTQQTCRELVLMVNTIIDTGLVEGRDHLTLHPLPLLDILQDILRLREGIVLREGRTVRVAVPATALVLAAPLKLQQIVYNLLTIALTLSPAGSDIQVVSCEQGEMIVVHVRFCSKGITREELERLTTPFGQRGPTPEALSSHVHGSSLGLYASKALLEAMGGRFWIESSEQEAVSIFAFGLLSAPGDPKTMQSRLIERSKGPPQ